MSEKGKVYEDEFVKIPNFPNYLIHVATKTIYRRIKDNQYFPMSYGEFDGVKKVRIHNESLVLWLSEYRVKVLVEQLSKIKCLVERVERIKINVSEAK